MRKLNLREINLPKVIELLWVELGFKFPSDCKQPRQWPGDSLESSPILLLFIMTRFGSRKRVAISNSLEASPHITIIRDSTLVVC